MLALISFPYYLMDMIVSEDDSSWYPKQKVMMAKKKLQGYNSARLMLWVCWSKERYSVVVWSSSCCVAVSQDWLETRSREQERVCAHGEGSLGRTWGASSLTSGRKMQQCGGTGCLPHWSRHGSKHPGASLWRLGGLGLVEEYITCISVLSYCNAYIELHSQMVKQIRVHVLMYPLISTHSTLPFTQFVQALSRF